MVSEIEGGAVVSEIEGGGHGTKRYCMQANLGALSTKGALNSPSRGRQQHSQQHQGDHKARMSQGVYTTFTKVWI